MKGLFILMLFLKSVAKREHSSEAQEGESDVIEQLNIYHLQGLNTS